MFPIFFSTKKDKQKPIKMKVNTSKYSPFNIWLKICNKLFKTNYVAIVNIFTCTIHTIKDNMVPHSRLWEHEMWHLKQIRDNAVIPFAFKYLFELITKGYSKNKFEVEAYKMDKKCNCTPEEIRINWE